MIRRAVLLLAIILGLGLAFAPGPGDARGDQARGDQAGPPVRDQAGASTRAQAGPAPAPRARGKRGHRSSVIAGRDCSECHTTSGWSMTAMAGAGGGFDHARTGFPLTGAHTQVPCVSCHLAERTTERECMGCHQDEHEGRLGLQCDQCHDARNWRSTRAVQRHRMTRLPLTGVHALLDCTACHARTTDRTYTEVPADCFACHEKDYRSDIHPVHQGDPNNPSLAPFTRDCGACHRPIGWAPAVVNPRIFGLTGSGAGLGAGTAAGMSHGARASHDLRFPISFGKHRAADCESCHPVPASPRLVACTGCHAHSPLRLRRDHGGSTVATDGAGCLGCHPGGAAR